MTFKSVTGNESKKVNTNKLIWNAYFPLIHLLPIFLFFYFFFFVRINIFYSENNQYVYNFYGTDLYVCRGVFRTQSNIYGEASLWKSRKTFIADVLPVSKYAFGISFTVEKVYRNSICHFGLRNPRYTPALNFLGINF